MASEGGHYVNYRGGLFTLALVRKCRNDYDCMSFEKHHSKTFFKGLFESSIEIKITIFILA